MWTGGHTEVVPFTIKSVVFFVTLLPAMYTGVKVRNKITHNVKNIYPPKRLNIQGEYYH